MKLYTFQSLEVLGLIQKNKIYFPEWDNCSCFGPPLLDEFANAYAYMMFQYNKRKGHEYSCPPVFWYTDLKQVIEALKRKHEDNNILITANVPDKYILLYNSNDYYAVLGNNGLGTYSSDLHDNDWSETTQKRFDLTYDIYKKNEDARVETWNEIFNITKRDKYKTYIHAITPYICDIWIKPKVITEENTSEMCMT